MSQNKGLFILIAGANASGKSSVIRPKYIKGRAKYYVNPDKIELDDPDFPIAEEDILSPKAREALKEGNANRFAVLCVDDWLKSERHRNAGIATESNLVSGRDFRKFEEAKGHNISTELYFVYVPLSDAIRREKIRTANEEQDSIGEKRVKERYRGLYRIKKHMTAPESKPDVLIIYDNSRGMGEEKLILHIEDGKTVYLHPEPPLWLQETGIEIPPFREKGKEDKDRLPPPLRSL
jgi:predicted ABC-type ATPase